LVKSHNPQILIIIARFTDHRKVSNIEIWLERAKKHSIEEYKSKILEMKMPYLLFFNFIASSSIVANIDIEIQPLIISPCKRESKM